MAHIIVHAGTHKTGSSFIQNTLFENEALLAEHGVIYPRTGVRLAFPKTGRSHRGFRHIGSDGTDELFTLLLDEIERSGAHTAVISYEGLFRPGYVPEALRKGLGGHDVTLVLTIRNPIDYIESRYRQWVQSAGFSGEPAEFIMRHGSALHLLGELPRWQAAFDGRLAVMSFDHISNPDGLANDVLKAGGIEVPPLTPTSLRNPTLSNASTLLRLVRNQQQKQGIDLSEGLRGAKRFPYPGNGGRLLNDALIEEIMGLPWERYEAAMRLAGHEQGAPSKWATRPFDEAFFDPAVREEVARVLTRAFQEKRAKAAARNSFTSKAKRAVKRLLGRA